MADPNQALRLFPSLDPPSTPMECPGLGSNPTSSAINVGYGVLQPPGPVAHLSSYYTASTYARASTPNCTYSSQPDQLYACAQVSAPSQLASPLPQATVATPQRLASTITGTAAHDVGIAAPLAICPPQASSITPSQNAVSSSIVPAVEHKISPFGCVQGTTTGNGQLALTGSVISASAVAVAIHGAPSPSIPMGKVLAVDGQKLNLEQSLQALPKNVGTLEEQRALALAQQWEYRNNVKEEWKKFPSATCQQLEAGYVMHSEHQASSVARIIEGNMHLNADYSRMLLINPSNPGSVPTLIQRAEPPVREGNKTENMCVLSEEAGGETDYRQLVINDQIKAIDDRLREMRKTMTPEERKAELKKMRVRFHPDNKDPSLAWLFTALSKHVNTRE